MKIFYIGYWSASDNLSIVTIYPHLKILSELGHETIIYVSIERDKKQKFDVPKIRGLTHYPLKTGYFSWRILNKLYEFVFLKKKMLSLAKEYGIQVAICRTSLAGIYGHYLCKKLSIPYVVESFEPHGRYMTETGTWRKRGLSARLYDLWEQKQWENAAFLIPVTENYKHYLIEKNVNPEKLIVMPCAVDAEMFSYSAQHRDKIREMLQVKPNETIGIYVGKFGGIYYDITSATYLFKRTFSFFENFHLIILTPQNKEEIVATFKAAEIDLNKVTISCVSNKEVPGYLSASDFAFSLHTPSPAIKYVNPIKNGEYWACGLPILITRGVGDDATIIENEGGGAVFSKSMNDIQYALQKITDLFNKRTEIRSLAKRHRSLDTVKNTYSKTLGQFAEKKL